MSRPPENAALAEAFEATFGRAPTGFLFSPGRVNLIGEHIDYCGGLVLPMAISRGTRFAYAARREPVVRVYSSRFGEQVEARASTHASPVGHWRDYVVGVVRELGGGTGADIYVTDDIAAGGLSSSASFSVGIARVLTMLSGRGIASDADRLEIARLCRRAENDFVGVPCGIMDQASVALGGIIKLDCATLAFERVPADFGDTTIVVLDTGRQRTLAASRYRERVEQIRSICATLGQGYMPDSLSRDVEEDALDACCARLDPILAKRLRHVVTEQARVERAFTVLAEGDLSSFGRLMAKSHDSLRDDYEVTGRELDALVDASLDQPGVLGARMTGAGFGGCAIALVEKNALEDFTESVTERYRKVVGLEARVFAV